MTIKNIMSIKIVKIVLGILLTLIAFKSIFGLLFIFINAETYFWGIKIEGINAIIFVLINSIIGFVTIYLFCKTGINKQNILLMLLFFILNLQF